MAGFAFFFDATRCSGCKTCVVACRDLHDLADGETLRRVYLVTAGSTARDERGFISSDCRAYTISLACNHCDDGVCMKVCPTGAMHKDERGFVVVDGMRCIGCGYCHLACPYDAPYVNRRKGRSEKCDGCTERVAAGEAPTCVTACPARALDFGSWEEMAGKGGLADLFPLPDPNMTSPNLYLKKPDDLDRPLSDDPASIENRGELA